MNKSVVLLSSGLDSTVNLYMSHQSEQVVLALTFDYGQRAVAKEIEKSKALCEVLKIPHKVIDVRWVKELGGSALIDSNIKLPTADQVKIDDLKQSTETAKSVWVPNRNGIFLNIAAGYAESLRADFIIPGFNKEEAATFPDNSLDYINKATEALSYSTANKVQVKCYTISMDKVEIVKNALKLQVPFKMMWPCYQSESQWCGECESCKRSKRAFEANGLDLKEYFKV